MPYSVRTKASPDTARGISMRSVLMPSKELFLGLVTLLIAFEATRLPPLHWNQLYMIPVALPIVPGRCMHC